MKTPEPGKREVLLCPSSQPDIPGSAIFAVRTEAHGQPSLSYLDQAVPATPELLALTAPLDPTSVMRLAAPCQTEGCPHFAERRCTLATKVAALLPTAVDELIPCAVRKTCRWFVQEGREICRRCPSIVSVVDDASSALRAVADPRTRLPRHLPILP